MMSDQGARTHGKQSIFAPKTGGARLQGLLTKVGTVRFERARARLAVLAKRDTASDGDTMEFLARGEADTRRYLAQSARKR